MIRILLSCWLIACVSVGFAQQFIPNAAAYSCQAHKQASVVAISEASKAAVSRTDTFDVLHYNIVLDISNLASKTISGYCDVKLQVKKGGITNFDLDLLALTVDSVKEGNTLLNFSHTGELLRITRPTALSVGDSTTLRVYYGGQPVMDASGWGGFYFSGNYAFNLGVGFAADPHNYGRVWFPCVDNFVDRATYDFFITTAKGNTAFCNGLLIDSVAAATTTTWHWKLTETIPTYLVNVAVADYTWVQSTYAGIAGSFPLVIAARAQDTVNAKASFIHLPDAVAAFEQDYGPQPFSRVGFALVPFNSGAMEHATNIAYPVYAANGSLAFESLMAHELSHHWWGNQVTCRTAQDMWLNEGWASYSESIFAEYVYGRDAYKKSVRANHYDVLRMAHINDDGYWGVSGLPHQYTYGDHVYNKGADVAHTLRAYLGDTDFFTCLKAYQQSYAFKDASSQNFRDALQACSGVDLTDFFNNWVFGAGFAHFSVDSFTATANDNGFTVVTSLRQKLKYAQQYYNGVPLTLTYYGEDWHKEERKISMAGGCGTYETDLPFEPVFVGVDMEELISDATTDKFMTLNAAGSYDFEEALMTIEVNQVTDSALVRVEHNWLAPDPLRIPTPGFHLSRERYFKVDGIFPNGFSADASFFFDGTVNGNRSYLDNELLASGVEDSLVLMYRRSARTDWAPFPNYTIDKQGSSTNKRGLVLINGLVQGEYALAITDAGRADSNIVRIAPPCNEITRIDLDDLDDKPAFKIFPNPVNDSFTLQLEEPLATVAELQVVNIQGAIVLRKGMESGTEQLRVDVRTLTTGTYFVSVQVGRVTLKGKQLLKIE